MSHNTTRRTLSLAALAAALVFADAGHAQVETDPRFGEDPRDVPDPRDGDDPRDEAPDPRDIGDKFGDHVGTLLDNDLAGRAARDLGLESWSVEPIVGTLVDRWLDAVDTPAGQTLSAAQVAKAKDLRARGIRLAELADQSLRDTRFMHWVETVHGWNATERATYREAEALRALGNKQLRSVTSADEALTTLTSFSQALAHYRSLGDTRRIAELHSTIGDIHAENGHVAQATDHLLRAERMGREIKSADTVDATLTSLELLLARTENYEGLLDVLDRKIVFASERRDGANAQRLLAQRLQLELQLDGQDARIVTVPRGNDEP